MPECRHNSAEYRVKKPLCARCWFSTLCSHLLSNNAWVGLKGEMQTDSLWFIANFDLAAACTFDCKYIKSSLYMLLGCHGINLWACTSQPNHLGKMRLDTLQPPIIHPNLYTRVGTHRLYTSLLWHHTLVCGLPLWNLQSSNVPVAILDYGCYHLHFFNQWTVFRSFRIFVAGWNRYMDEF